MSRGVWESLFGLLFSWLPGVGLILSVAGFCRQAVRLTEKHKIRRFFSMAFASVVLVVAIGALVGEAYLYSRDPGFAGKAGLWVWQKVTGQQALPGSEAGGIMGIDGYMPDEAVPDEYYTDDQMEEGDVPIGDEQMEEGDVPVDDGQMEEGDAAIPEGDFQDDIDFIEDDSDEEGGEPGQSLPPLSDLLKSHGVAVG